MGATGRSYTGRDLCLFPSILRANFSDARGQTYQEAQGVIDQRRLDHEFSCGNWERALTACGNNKVLLTIKWCAVQLSNSIQGCFGATFGPHFQESIQARVGMDGGRILHQPSGIDSWVHSSVQVMTQHAQHCHKLPRWCEIWVSERFCPTTGAGTQR